MKRLICMLLALSLLMGCGQRKLTPRQEIQQSTATPTTPRPTAVSTAEPVTPAPTAAPKPTLATCAPVIDATAHFPEECIFQDGEPLASLVRSLLTEHGLSKTDFHGRFRQIIAQVDALDKTIVDLSNAGRTLTADRKERTVQALTQLMDRDMLDALQDAYDRCPQDGADLPLSEYADTVTTLIRSVQGMDERTSTFFELGTESAMDYRTALARYIGEPVVPRNLFDAMEDLAQTEAYALSAILQADPEVARRKESISFGSYGKDMAFLCEVTEKLVPLPDGALLPVPADGSAAEDMDILELAFRCYPGMLYLKTYAAHSTPEQQARWANAPDGYLSGLAIHNAYATISYLDDFGRDYVQYRWYEDMLTVTLTGLSALLIHYFGYSQGDLAAYLASWGAEDYAEYLYDRAMSDPFESLVATYGYYRYLEICEAALSAGCPSERQFLRDYLAVGPAPFDALKEYMVGLYGNQG